MFKPYAKIGLSVIPPSRFCRSLNLAENSFSGSIPIALAAASSLQALSLQGNALIGNIPVWISALSSLSSLWLSDNQLTSEVPVTVTKMTNLAYVKACTCHG